MANRRDPAWKYGIEVEDDGKKFMRCAFCEKKIRGGVFRMKEHLAGTQGNVAPCLKVPPEVRDEIRNYMDMSGKKKRMNQLIREERIDHCTTMHSRETGGSNTGSVTQRGVRGPMDRFLSSAEDNTAEDREIEGTRIGSTDRELREKTCMDIGRFFFENGIAFNIANSTSFVNMIRSVGRYGTGLKPPSAYELRTWVLKKEEEKTKLLVDDVMKSWAQTGVSILSDGWKDMRGRQLINILVNNPHGTVFLRSVDASDAVKDASLLFNLLDDVVEEVGEDIVVQVVTYNASNYKRREKC